MTIFAEKYDIMIDTIQKPMKLHLQTPVENMSILCDSNTGVKSYHIVLDSAKQDNPTSPYWGICVGLLVALLLATLLFFRRRSKGHNSSKENAQETALRNDLLRQSEAYKLFVGKGYFTVSKNSSFVVVKEQEIRDLCDAVADVFSSFSEWLRTKELADKDFQFCCLLKSGLTTYELSEIYCVSESAIFKRKHKLKEILGYKSEKRTLDEILQAM